MPIPGQRRRARLPGPRLLLIDPTLQRDAVGGKEEQRRDSNAGRSPAQRRRRIRRIGNIHLWEAANGGVVLPLAEHKNSIRALAWRTDSSVLASCSEDGNVVWWDVIDGFPVVIKADAHPPQKPSGTYGKVANGVLDCSFGPGG